MNVLLDVQLLGRLLIALGVAQLVPALAAALFGEPVLPYAASAIAAAVFGASFSYGSRPGDRKNDRSRGDKANCPHSAVPDVLEIQAVGQPQHRSKNNKPNDKRNQPNSKHEFTIGRKPELEPFQLNNRIIRRRVNCTPVARA